MEHTFLKYIRWISILIVLSLGVYFIYAGLHMDEDSYIGKMATQHFPAIIGLPSAAIASFFLVLILRQTFGTIEFKGLGFEFKGASGEIVLWIFSFLSIAGAIKLLW